MIAAYEFFLAHPFVCLAVAIAAATISVLVGPEAGGYRYSPETAAMTVWTWLVYGVSTYLANVGPSMVANDLLAEFFGVAAAALTACMALVALVSLVGYLAWTARRSRAAR